MAASTRSRFIVFRGYAAPDRSGADGACLPLRAAAGRASQLAALPMCQTLPPASSLHRLMALAGAVVAGIDGDGTGVAVVEPTTPSRMYSVYCMTVPAGSMLFPLRGGPTA